jgi:two-component system sensor histidine kinase/response regulator
MTGLAHALASRVLDPWVPAELRRAGPDALRRARLLLCIAGLHTGISATFALAHALAGAWTLALWAGASAALGGTSVLVLRATRSVSCAARCELAIAMLVLGGVSVAHTGLMGNSIHLLAGAIPLLATALLGGREGFGWTLGVLALVSLIAWIHPEGAHYEVVYGAGAATRVRWFGAVALAGTVFLIGAVLEAVRRSALEELRSANAALLRANQEAAAAAAVKARFLASMSHEMRTPLNSVVATTDLLARSELPAERRDLAESAFQGALSLLTLFQQLIDATLESGSIAPEHVECDLGEIVYGVARAFAPRGTQRDWVLIVDYAADAPVRFRGDPLRIRQVLHHLVANATRFTASGHVRISVQRAGKRSPCAGTGEARSEPQASEAGRPQATHKTGATPHVRVEVADTGCGIAPEARAGLFRRRERSDDASLRSSGGLGLAISHRLVRDMRGEMGVESEPGRGSTFWFELPCEECAACERPRTSVPTEARIALLEPHPLARACMESQLAGLGVRCRSFDDPDEARRALSEAARSGEPFRALLIPHDPPRCDALAWLATRERGAPPSIVLSTDPCPPEAGARARSGIAAWLPAPVSSTRLLEAIGVQLERRAGRRSDVANRSILESLRVLEGLRVLIVEDFAPNQKIARHILQRLGCEVDLAANGVEALEALEKNDYDIVLMDCQMPEMDGYEATRRYREVEVERGGRRVPIIAVTANALPGDREQCLDAGMDDYVAKPIKLETLRDALLRHS